MPINTNATELARFISTFEAIGIDIFSEHLNFKNFMRKTFGFRSENKTVTFAVI